MASATQIKTVIIQGSNEPAGCINHECPVKSYCSRYGSNTHELWPFNGHITGRKCTGFIEKYVALKTTKAHRRNFIQGK